MKQWDYSDCGWYFVTICAKKRKCLFGFVKNDEIVLNKRGKLAKQCWEELPTHFPGVEIDEFIVMPNHVHGIVVINGNCRGRRSAENTSLCRDKACLVPNRKYMKLSTIIGSLKSSVTRKINQTSGDHFAWQRSFHDHIIRDENDLQRIQHYIHFNACKWKEDAFFVARN